MKRLIISALCAVAFGASGVSAAEGRSGPGRMYLASPYTVAASATEGKIVAWKPGTFAR